MRSSRELVEEAAELTVGVEEQMSLAPLVRDPRGGQTGVIFLGCLAAVALQELAALLESERKK